MLRSLSRRPRLIILVGSLFGVLLAGIPAHAQSADTERRAAAQILFDDAQQLLKQREFARACAKLEEVNRLQPGKIGAMMELASCYESWGKTASAWARYRTASELATKAGDPRRADADAKAAALEPLVSRLVVLVPETMKWLGGLVVERDGVPLGAATWGVGMPVDPGAHEIAATAPNKKKWSTRVEILRPGSTLTATVPELEDAPRETARSSGGMPTLRTAGFVVGGLGLLGVGIGAVFGAQAAAKQGEANKLCDADSCTTPGHELEQQAFSNAAVSTGAFLVGGALVAGGLTMVLWPSQKPGAGTPAARVMVGPASLSVQGAW